MYWAIQFDYLLDYIDLVFDRIIVYKPICHNITYFILIFFTYMFLNRSKNTINNFPCSIKFPQMFVDQNRNAFSRFCKAKGHVASFTGSPG